MESVLGEEEVCSRRTRITAKKGLTFDPTIGTAQIFTGVSKGLFSLELVWNPYLVKWRSVRIRPE
jgi:hypothetical protein